MYDASMVLHHLPDPFDTQHARAAGLTQSVMERLVRSRQVARVHKGLFRQLPPPDPDVERWEHIREEHLARLRLALMAHPHHAASHLSAAALYGWPVRLHPTTLVHLTAVTVEPRSRRVSDRFLHHSDSIVNEVELVDSTRVLRRARTVADCLRCMRPPSAVAIADAALREGFVSGDDIRGVLDTQYRWVGRPRARRSLQLVDPRRESWLESFSFVTLFALGVDSPVPQVEVFDAAYRFVGRVDGMWVDDATVAEADGMGKYLGSSADPTSGRTAGEDAARRVVAERKRERGLIDLGLHVVRWDTDEIVHDPRGVAHRVQAARGAGDLTRFTGYLRVDGDWMCASTRQPHRPDTP